MLTSRWLTRRPAGDGSSTVTAAASGWPSAAVRAIIDDLVVPLDVPAAHEWYYARIEHLGPLLDRLSPTSCSDRNVN